MQQVKQALIALHQACLEYLSRNVVSDADPYKSVVDLILSDDATVSASFKNGELVRFMAMLNNGAQVLPPSDYYDLHLQFMLQRILDAESVATISAIITKIVMGRYAALIKSNGSDATAALQIIREHPLEWKVLSDLFPIYKTDTAEGLLANLKSIAVSPATVACSPQPSIEAIAAACAKLSGEKADATPSPTST